MDVAQILDTAGVDYEDGDRRLMVVCPFHDDNTPSCGIWADTGWFKCFACGAEGSLVDFLMESLSISRGEAYRMTRGEDSVSEMEDRIRAFLKSDDDTYKYFNVRSFHKVYPPLSRWKAGMEYVQGRGVPLELVERFDMRAGVKKYAGRVVMPIFTPSGQLVSYVGRAVSPGKVPKTRKSRSPHRTLYGLSEIVTFWGPGKHDIVVVEGEFDALYLQGLGIPAVANMGTSPMGAEKIRLLRRYAKRVVLSYDGDEAGYRAMYGDESKSGELERLARHLPTSTVRLPDGADPNTLTEKQVEEYYGVYKI